MLLQLSNISKGRIYLIVKNLVPKRDLLSIWLHKGSKRSIKMLWGIIKQFYCTQEHGISEEKVKRSHGQEDYGMITVLYLLIIIVRSRSQNYIHYDSILNYAPPSSTLLEKKAHTYSILIRSEFFILKSIIFLRRISSDERRMGNALWREQFTRL